MSVVFPITEDPRFRRYTASLGQTVFGVPFPFQDAKDIAVLELSGDTYAEVQVSDYAVTGEGTPTGGTVTFGAGRTQGTVIVILGRAIIERLSSIVANGKYKSSLIDAELDRNRLIQQEQARDIARALKAKFGDDPQDLPSPSAGALLGWIGGALANIPNTSQSITDALAASAAALAAANAGYVFDTQTDLSAATVPNVLDFVRTAGNLAVGDGGEATWRRTSAPDAPGYIPSASYNTGFWTFDGQAPTRWSFVLNPQGVAPGKRALRSSGADHDASVGVAYQRGILNQFYPVTAGRHYGVSGAIDSAVTPKGFAKVSVYWYDASNVFLSSSLAYTYDVALSAAVRTFSGISVMAPEGAAFARFACEHTRNAGNLIGGTVDFYDLRLDEMGSAIVQSLDGAWFDLAEPNGKTISIKAFGARLSASQSPAQRRAKIQAAIDWAAPRGYTVYIPAGVWFVDGTVLARDRSVIDGAGMRVSILRFADTVATDLNVLQPAAFDMSIGHVRVSDLTLDPNRAARVANGTIVIPVGGLPGDERPGASGWASMSAHDCIFYRVHVTDTALHGLDDCAGGDLNEEGKRRYQLPEGPTAYSTTPSKNNAYIECEVDNWLDDAFTTHYTKNVGFWRCKAFNCGSTLSSSCGFEVDDGTEGFSIVDCEVDGSARGIIAKSHAGVPCGSRGVIIRNRVRRVNHGISIAGDPGAGPAGTEFIVQGNRVTDPLKWSPTLDINAYRITNVGNFIHSDNAAIAPPGTVGLGAAIWITFGARGGLVTNYLIDNWPGADNTSDLDRASIRVSASDILLGAGRIFGGSFRGIYWSGAPLAPRTIGPVIMEGYNTASGVGIHLAVAGDDNIQAAIAGFPGKVLRTSNAWNDKPANLMSGHLYVGGHLSTNDTVSRTYSALQHAVADVAGDQVLAVSQFNGGQSLNVYARGTGDTGYNAGNACAKVSIMQTTGRSINAGGTINASGADYAEYHEVQPHLHGAVPAGAILGFAADGLLTDRLADVVGRHVIKSTNPYGVGGDDWGSEERVCAAQGCAPIGGEPEAREVAEPPADADEIAWAAYAKDQALALEELEAVVEAREERKAQFAVAYEAERAKRDRIAKSGYVPVNIAASTSDIGKYLVPIDDGAGGITAELVDMNAAEDAATTIAALRAVQKAYRRAIGTVIGVMDDGRPLVEVKVG